MALFAVWLATLYFLSQPLIFGVKAVFKYEKYFLSAIFLIIFLYIPLNTNRIIGFIKSNRVLTTILLFFYLLPFAYYQNFFTFKKPFIDLSLAIILFIVFPKNTSNRYIHLITWCFLGLFIFLSLPIHLFHNQFWNHDLTYKGNFIHRNALGYFWIPVNIWALYSNLDKRCRFLIVVYGLILVTVSTSRSFWVSSFLINLIYLLQTRKKAMCLGLCVFFLLTLFFWSARGKACTRKLLAYSGIKTFQAWANSKTLNNDRTFDTSSIERWDLIKQGLLQLRHSWGPGVGLGAPTKADSRFTKDSDLTNFFLTHLISYGVLVSICSFSLFIFFFIQSGMRSRLLMIHLCVFGCFQPFFDYFQSTYFFVFLAMLYIMTVLDTRDIAQLNAH